MFFVSNLCKTELALSYVFQIRKQGGKYFSHRIRTKFFLKNIFKKDRQEFSQKNHGNASRGRFE